MQCRTETKAWFYKFWYLAVFSRVNWNSLCSDNAEVTNWNLQEEKLFTRVVYWCSTNQPSLSALVVHSLLFIIIIGALTLLLFTCKKTLWKSLIIIIGVPKRNLKLLSLFYDTTRWLLEAKHLKERETVVYYNVWVVL